MALLSIELKINEKLYKSDPQHTVLGRKLLQYSVLMIDELGIEDFNFKKLAIQAGATEAAVYRYFENKYALLIYLVNWYWEWMRFRLEFRTLDLQTPEQRLRAAISCIVDTAKRDAEIAFIDEDVLHRIVVAEGTKAYHNKAVDVQNRNGYFQAYKAICDKVSAIILENRPSFPYPRALAINLLEMASNHIYFAAHLPGLTEVKDGDDVLAQVEDLLLYFAWQSLRGASPKSGNQPK